MSYTAQQILDKARLSLNDAAKVRYPDDSLLSYLNDAYLYMRKRRPDLFVGLWASAPTTLVVGSTWVLPDVYVPVVADFVSARAKLVDTEAEDGTRVDRLLLLFEKGLLGA